MRRSFLFVHNSINRPRPYPSYCSSNASYTMRVNRIHTATRNNNVFRRSPLHAHSSRSRDLNAGTKWRGKYMRNTGNPATPWLNVCKGDYTTQRVKRARSHSSWFVSDCLREHNSIKEYFAVVIFVTVFCLFSPNLAVTLSVIFRSHSFRYEKRCSTTEVWTQAGN